MLKTKRQKLTQWLAMVALALLLISAPALPAVHADCTNNSSPTCGG